MHSRTLVAALAALLVAPAATATWYSYGTYEPDNALDSKSYMWWDKPGAVKDRVYFNAYITTGPATANGGIANPNVGVLESGIDAPGPSYFEAVLGVWVDCNGDGYIGMAETAVREYRNELLQNKALCPPLTGSGTSWPVGAHNYNNLVTELIPIGNKLTTNADKRVYKDNDAAVWGDNGRPDTVPREGTGSCNVGFARGQTQSTGGLISYADCQGTRGLAARWNTVANAAGQPGLGFEDPNRPQESSSPLNQPTFGDDGTEHSAVYLQDCNAAPLARTPDLPGDDLDNRAIARPVPANPVNGDVQSWTVPGTLNATMESMTIRDTNSNDDYDCDTSNDRGEDFYGALEGDFQGTTVPKRKANWNFNFSTASRGTVPAFVLGSGAANHPTDFGVEALGSGCTASGCMQSAWGADSQTTNYQPSTVAVRTDVVGNNVGVDIADPSYFTFYASVGAATTDRFKTPSTTPGIYGIDQCAGATSGIRNNWHCDPNQWYILPSGEPSPEPRPLARPGKAYQLRDVDCYDGRINGLGVGVLPSYYGPNACKPAAP